MNTILIEFVIFSRNHWGKFRNIFAVIAGVILGSVVNMSFIVAGSIVFPLPVQILAGPIVEPKVPLIIILAAILTSIKSRTWFPFVKLAASPFFNV